MPTAHAEAPIQEVVEEEIVVIEETIEQYIIRRFEEENLPTHFVLDIVREESEFNPRAYNPEWHRGCQGSYGIFQIACLHYPENPEALFDEKFNIETAIKLAKRDGFYIWGVCNPTKYSPAKVNCN